MELADLAGKTIASVVVDQGSPVWDSECMDIVIVFTDDSRLELYPQVSRGGDDAWIKAELTERGPKNVVAALEIRGSPFR